MSDKLYTYKVMKNGIPVGWMYPNPGGEEGVSGTEIDNDEAALNFAKQVKRNYPGTEVMLVILNKEQ